MRFAFIEENEQSFEVTAMCQTFQVSRSGYYAWKRREPGVRQLRQQKLTEEIRAIHQENQQVYGSPRIHQELQERGRKCSVNTVAKWMREAEIRAKTTKKFCVTTDSNHHLRVAENLLNQQFDSPTQANQVWVSDITYLWTDEGWLYLAAVLDLYTRKVVGWSMSKTMTADLVGDALKMAIGRHHPGEGLLIHSDRGSQYASDAYQRLLREYGIKCSMSRKGNCWDNAPMESFFATLKKELVYQERYTTRQRARLSVFVYIETFYNRKRKHSALGYKSPEQFEQAT